MKRFLTRTLTATLCMLILVLPAMATDTPVNNNDFGQANNSDIEQVDGPQTVSGLTSNPTGVNLGSQQTESTGDLPLQRERLDPNYDVAMETQFDQGPIDCECSGTFEVGDRVMALVNSPSGAAGVFAGDEGWVICGSGSNPDILVSWDGWTSGHDGNSACVCPVSSALPQNSGWFVLCSEISVLATEPVTCICSGVWTTGDRIVAAVDNPQGASGILAGHTGTVVGGVPTGFPNLFISWDNWTSGHTGGIAGCPGVTLPNNSGWYVDCPDVAPESDVDCVCAGAFASGDRVTATSSNPQGASTLPMGRGGTVICGVTGFPPTYLLISWDDWQFGHDGNGFCECPVDSLSDNSGWWIDCPDVTPSVNVSCTCGGIYNTGDRVEALVDNPDGHPDLFTGSLGTVVAGSSSFPDWILVTWDGLTTGHTGGGTDCPVTTALDNPSGWWIMCAEVGPAGSGPTNTISVALSASPNTGFVPFVTQFTAQLNNLTTENRRAAGRINVVIASGAVFNNWRAGWTNLSSLENFSVSWNTNFPALPTLLGNNTFTLLGQDVTPAPFNQPPYAAAGDTDSDVETVVAN